MVQMYRRRDTAYRRRATDRLKERIVSTPLVRNIVTSHADPGWNYGYARSPFFQFSHARGASYLVYNRRLMPIFFADADRTADY